MNKSDLAAYYASHFKEFYGERGHEELLKNLKKLIDPASLNLSTNQLGIDVGCNIGSYLANFTELCNASARIRAFEPNPANLAVLEPMVDTLSNVDLYKFCLSDVDTKTTLFNWIDSDQNLVGNGLAGLTAGGEKICDVDVFRLDTFLDQQYANAEIEFIKIDTEGHDTKVIKGIGDYLNRTK